MKENSGSSGNTLLWLVLSIILLLIITFGITKLSDSEDTSTADVKTASEYTQTTTVTTTVTVTETTVTTTVTKISIGISDYDIYSHAAVLADKNGNIIFATNENEQIYPASLTKIMTALVAIENLENLEETVSVPGDIFDYIAMEQASTAGFSAYETVTFNDLLYGTLLSSGAECSLTLAVYIAGSEEMFVRMMNEKAQEIGMKNTYFTNVCGLHSYEHFSTASDISLLLSYALKNDTFRKVFTTDEYYTTTDYQPYGITLYSTMFSQMSSDSFEGGKLLGGKTGFTSEAGLCLASLAQINGQEYTLITVGANGSHYTEPFNIYDAYTVYEALASAVTDIQ